MNTDINGMAWHPMFQHDLMTTTAVSQAFYPNESLSRAMRGTVTVLGDTKAAVVTHDTHPHEMEVVS